VPKYARPPIANTSIMLLLLYNNKIFKKSKFIMRLL